MVYTLLSGPMVYTVYPLPLFSQENGIHHSFLLCDLGVGRQTEKEGCHGRGALLFFLGSFGTHLTTPALKTENFSKKLGRFSKTQKWIY